MWYADRHDSCYMWKVDPPVWSSVPHGISDWMMVSRANVHMTQTAL